MTRRMKLGGWRASARVLSSTFSQIGAASQRDTAIRSESRRQPLGQIGRAHQPDMNHREAPRPHPGVARTARVDHPARMIWPRSSCEGLRGAPRCTNLKLRGGRPRCRPLGSNSFAAQTALSALSPRHSLDTCDLSAVCSSPVSDDALGLGRRVKSAQPIAGSPVQEAQCRKPSAGGPLWLRDMTSS